MMYNGSVQRCCKHRLDATTNWIGVDCMGIVPVRTCTVDRCENRHEAKGLCKKHYERFRLNGTLEKRSRKKRVYSPYTPEKFFALVQKTDACWLWQGTIGNHGYGVLRHDKKQKLAHRFSFELHKHVIPSNVVIRHTCDVRTCVNPDHLILGTLEENVADMMMRNRSAKGESHSHAKLTEKEVLEILKIINVISAKSDKRIATRYGVHLGTIKDIRFGKTWRHVQIS